MARIDVKLTGRSYRIEVGYAIDERLRQETARHLATNRLFLFFDAGFYALHGAAVRAALALPARQVCEFVVPSGERYKSQATVDQVQSYLLSQKISRDDFILACGGGVLTDLVGYAAATVLRGVRWGAVPTTLLGMVDAAIGGKTGVNHRYGKNLIGAFWQPSFVHSDLRWLATLPSREFIAGFGEIVKYAGLQGGPMLDSLQRLDIGAVTARPERLRTIVAAAAWYKAGIVAADERDGGKRMVLNLGHTFAHGIERVLGYGRLRHGEAVGLGLLAMWHLSVAQRGRISRSMAGYRSIIEQFIRQIPYRQIDAEAVWEAMAGDKKRSGRRLRFVLLSQPGQPFIDDSVTPARARRALATALAQYRESGGSHAANTGRKRPKS